MGGKAATDFKVRFDIDEIILIPFLVGIAEYKIEGTLELPYKGMSVGGSFRRNLENFYCVRFDRWAHFLYNGQPILCCMDYTRETAFGPEGKSPLRELFDGDAFRGMIAKGCGRAESDPDFICKRCISPGG